MKKLIITTIFLVTGIYLSAQDSINSVILSMPDDIIYGLQASQKELLVATDLADTAVVTVSTNIYPDIKRLSITDSYVSLQTSDASTTQIKLLPLVNNSKIICVVKTVCGGFCDSKIQFYTTDWKPIDGSDLFPRPVIDWFIKPDADRNSDSFKNAVAVLDLTPIKISLSARHDTADIEYGISRYLSADDYEMLKPYLVQENKVLVWDKISFKEK